MGASQANFRDIMKHTIAESSGIPGTHSTSQSEIEDEIASINFFLLCH